MFVNDDYRQSCQPSIRFCMLFGSEKDARKTIEMNVLSDQVHSQQKAIFSFSIGCGVDGGADGEEGVLIN